MFSIGYSLICIRLEEGIFLVPLTFHNLQYQSTQRKKPMQSLNSKISINSATCELRARLTKTTRTNWGKLKSDLEKSKGRIYSDSAFLSHIIDDVLTPQISAILK
jgi:hypothetical protein